MPLSSEKRIDEVWNGSIEWLVLHKPLFELRNVLKFTLQLGDNF